MTVPDWEPGPVTALAGTRPPRNWEDASQAWADLLDGQSTGDAALAYCLTDLQDANVRDAMMVRTLTDDLDEPEKAIIGEMTTRPDWDRVDTATGILTDVLPQIAPNFRPNVLVMLGWMEWLKGNGSRAALWCKAAQADAPRHKLAGLLLELVETGRLARVAQFKDTAYRLK